MKKLFLLTLIVTNININAQTNTIEAFKNSYTYESQANYVKAITAFDNVNSKNSYSINLRLGWLQYLNANYSKSQAYYEKAIQLNSSSIEAKLGSIYPLKAMLNWDAVLKTYKEIVTIDNNHAASHYQIAYIYFIRKKYTEAAIHLTTVLKLYPFDYDANALLGSVYVKLGKIKEAKIHYTTALEYYPNDSAIESILNGL